ncbi:MAG: lysylphosphatidylglycerol synthase transmembrane domain-containing protein, partial [Candidatus Binatia bacterium]
ALVLSALIVAVVSSRRARRKIFAGLLGAAGVLSRPFVRRRAALTARLAVFEEELHEGVDFLISRGRAMVAPFVYIFLDWLLMLATLYAAFYCVGHAVPLHVVVIGFSAGVFLSVVNLVPGGLGLMEGSMAAIFSSLGTPLETAVVAAVIFRVVYYLLPLTVTLLFFPEMVKTVRRTAYAGGAAGR